MKNLILTVLLLAAVTANAAQPQPAAKPLTTKLTATYCLFNLESRILDRSLVCEGLPMIGTLDELYQRGWLVAATLPQPPEASFAFLFIERAGVGHD